MTKSWNVWFCCCCRITVERYISWNQNEGTMITNLKCSCWEPDVKQFQNRNHTMTSEIKTKSSHWQKMINNVWKDTVTHSVFPVWALQCEDASTHEPNPANYEYHLVWLFQNSVFWIHMQILQWTTNIFEVCLKYRKQGLRISEELAIIPRRISRSSMENNPILDRTYCIPSLVLPFVSLSTGCLWEGAVHFTFSKQCLSG